MSLILEALKKLEREKQAPDRGFLVMAQVPWAGEGRRGQMALMAVVLAAAVAVGFVARWLTGRDAPPAPAGPVGVASVPPTLPPPLSSPPAPPLRPAVQADVVPPFPRVVTPAPRRTAPARASTAPAVSPPPSLAETAPPAAEPLPALRLEAISQQDGVAVAIISGQLVREGDSVAGAMVVRIGVQEVELETDGRRSVLRF